MGGPHCESASSSRLQTSASVCPPTSAPTRPLLGVRCCIAPGSPLSPGSHSLPSAYFTPLSPVRQKYILNVNRNIKTGTRGVTCVHTFFLSGHTHLESSLGNSSQNSMLGACWSDQGGGWFFLILCASSNLLPASFPCSFVTTTFVMEAMAAANAQLHWKRMENHQVRMCPCLWAVPLASCVPKSQPSAASSFPRCGGLVSTAPLKDPVPQLKRNKICAASVLGALHHGSSFSPP